MTAIVGCLRKEQPFWATGSAVALEKLKNPQRAVPSADVTLRSCILCTDRKQ
jgi:hypothetical protein